MKETRGVNIAVLTDNIDDIISVMRVFKELWKNYELNVITDADEAIRYLQEQEESAKFAEPDLILVDVDFLDNGHVDKLGKLPWRQKPIILLKSPDADERATQQLKQWANCIITKPFSVDKPSEPS